MPTEGLIPIVGCWVMRRDAERPVLGRIEDSRREKERDEVRVRWGDGGTEWHDPRYLEPGFSLGWAVQDVPVSATRKPLGTGVIVGRRKLGGRHQILVQLDEDGRSVWLPYENLRRIKDVGLQYERAETRVADHAERLRLRLLAHALESWNHLTGALDRLDVDPLPHQIQLVHRILSSGNYNWLIADDVGLGKTIEVGLLLAAMKRKGQARRVLVVAPAGLTRQWQEEMQYKFDQHYVIYGRDILIQKHEHWKLHDQIIVSIDMAKRENHLALFRQAPGWDIVVFDEGHKLTRHASGERTERYRLAEALRKMSDAFLLLSGTPHQGYADRFIALLELIRPDLRKQLHTLEANPEVVSELILRNRKSEVTDPDGNFIFHGQQIHRVPVTPLKEARRFNFLLQDYLRRGYRAGEVGGMTGRAIGFVMTTYRKLSSSSIAAIEHALHRRLERLSGEGQHDGTELADEARTLDDLVEGGDDQDDLAADSAPGKIGQFFEFERNLIEELLKSAKQVKGKDEKLRMFLEDVVSPLVAEKRKLVVFTEYRATQTYLQEALKRRFPRAGAVELINGSLTLDEKLNAISAFNESSQFLISTEAGGEGINLHRSCHIMVNYDLPWNPARLVQRIGRLYRYGQTETVVVFNLHAQDSFDNSVIDLMLQRVSQIVRDMTPVGSDFNERLYAEILGDVLESVDLSEILQSATDMKVERTSKQIDEALNRAKLAKQMQDELFTHIAGYDPNALEGTLGFTMQHVNLFVRGMLPILDIRVEAELHDGDVLEVRLPDCMRGRFAEFGQRTVVRISTDRRTVRGTRGVVLLDFETPFFQHLIELAKSQQFDGFYAAVEPSSSELGVLAAVKLRWQDDQGEPLTEDFVIFFSDASGIVQANPPFIAHWLVSPLVAATLPKVERGERRKAFNRILVAASERLLAESTRFKHPNGLVPLASADCKPATRLPAKLRLET